MFNFDRRNIENLSNEVYNGAFEISQAAMGAVVKAEVEQNGRNHVDSSRVAHVGCSLAAGTLVPLAMFFANRDKIHAKAKERGLVVESLSNIDPEIVKKGNELAFTLVNPETLTFAALVAALCTSDHSAETCTASFGPVIIWEALEQWQKLFPEKKPEDYLDGPLVEIARSAGRDSMGPLDKFLSSRINAGSSKTIN